MDNSMSQTLSAERVSQMDQETWMKYVREKAHIATMIDLRDYNWMSLDADTARKIHAMLPKDR